ncbi:YAE1 [Candida jiufengensis]|uniref:YAE1 n=1 Tax=Candida jiufengensis TaxID=497108 RepID=UPI002225944D|nr:YAE1 [Candida jiufengensis]KAI5950465.1 YAE1 [Candida jiufengensis]
MTPSECNKDNNNNTYFCPCKNPLPKETTTSQIQEIDDIWESDNENENQQPKDNFVHNDIIRQHQKQGYLDGITHNKETNLQQGFDDSFSLGGQLGIEVGMILAKVKILDHKNSNGLLNECINDLKISKIFDNKYFNENLEMINDQHELILKWKDKLKELEKM